MKNTNNRRDAVNAIIAYFEHNEDAFNDCIEDLDAYNGFLDDDRYYSMEELDDLYDGQSATEILCRAFYGYDAETRTKDSDGEKRYGAFNPNRDYFRFNGYGNLVSSNYKDYSDRLDRYAVDQMEENRDWIDAIERYDGLAELFDALEEADNDDEE